MDDSKLYMAEVVKQLHSFDEFFASNDPRKYLYQDQIHKRFTFYDIILCNIYFLLICGSLITLIDY